MALWEGKIWSNWVSNVHCNYTLSFCFRISAQHCMFSTNCYVFVTLTEHCKNTHFYSALWEWQKHHNLYQTYTAEQWCENRNSVSRYSAHFFPNLMIFVTLTEHCKNTNFYKVTLEWEHKYSNIFSKHQLSKQEGSQKTWFGRRFDENTRDRRRSKSAFRKCYISGHIDPQWSPFWRLLDTLSRITYNISCGSFWFFESDLRR